LELRLDLKSLKTDAFLNTIDMPGD
jgi:hypothetical protein